MQLANSSVSSSSRPPAHNRSQQQNRELRVSAPERIAIPGSANRRGETFGATARPSVGVSRKAFRLGKFLQDINAFRGLSFTSPAHFFLALVAYGGEGLYYFVEQFVWLGKAGLIDKKHLSQLQRISAWCELIGYIGSVSLKVKELQRISEDEAGVVSNIETAAVGGLARLADGEKLRKLREKKLLKRLSIAQDFADALMAVADIRDGKGLLSGKLLLSSAGLLSALISTHKNWVSC
nr:peroxisomal membrane protein 11A [Ipomoea batatas]